jgi:hypothetical protein
MQIFRESKRKYCWTISCKSLRKSRQWYQSDQMFLDRIIVASSYAIRYLKIFILSLGKSQKGRIPRWWGQFPPLRGDVAEW